MIYSWIQPKEHTLTVRNRSLGFAKLFKVWNQAVLDKAIKEQAPNTDIYITKYPKNRLVECIILDFDSEDNIELAWNDVKRMRNYLTKNGHNCVIVSSGAKGYHLYCQIAPFKFKDTEIRAIGDKNWERFFNAFVCFLIHDSKSQYPTLDERNTSAGLGGNIRLIGSRHPKTGNVCEIIDGEFVSEQIPTMIQDEAQKKAYCNLEIKEEEKQQQLKKVRVIRGNDPVANNDLRDVFKQLTGDIKLYPKGYGYCRCPYHGIDEHPSLLVTKEFFSCSACDFKGNVWTLRKMGLVDFDENGVVK